MQLHAQSSDIAQGVDAAGNKDEGAGDQGIMFGYACRETPELMPAPIYYAHASSSCCREARHSGESEALGPDAKSQVTLRYENGKPVEATQIVVSTQHLDEKPTSHDIKAIVEPYVRKALPAGWITKHTVWHVNPTGKFVIGGPDGDAGLTGRKIIVDTYGGAAPAWRRRVLRQGPDQGRPLGRLCGALSRQERGRRGPRRSLHDPDRLCDRRRQAAVDLCRQLRHRRGRRCAAREGARRGDGPARRAASASISASTGRSMRAPAPTAISAAPPEADGGFSWERTDLVDDLRSLAK